ncbi:hypothetical protein GWI33_013275 [Rhynchophorus ferrugineus]|uniref:Uncharacterized protein n=1 Tax=Rhynchophorus ferrugineus TaxID=354439 RepID=A0A834I6T3_RHYFE|nr:hypothetical protein GWI33_013275 [Rhynchophorus ferrugineus]
MSLNRPPSHTPTNISNDAPTYHADTQSTKTLTTKRHVLAEPPLPPPPNYARLTVKNVQISPPQASTEREPTISSLNAQKLIETRTDNDSGLNADVEIADEGQTGVIEIKGEKKLGNNVKIKRKTKYPKFPKKPRSMIHTRSLIDSGDEPDMAAADRIESYYLPPPGHSEKPQYSRSKQPSNIDFDAPGPTGRASSPALIASSPPDVVVTYDGKKVSGASLSAKPFEKSILLQQRGSKAAELIKARPQSVPFKGDLPPLNPDVLFDTKHLQKPTHAGVLSRDLDTPLPPPSGSTKLTRIKL